MPSGKSKASIFTKSKIPLFRVIELYGLHSNNRLYDSQLAVPTKKLDLPYKVTEAIYLANLIGTLKSPDRVHKLYYKYKFFKGPRFSGSKNERRDPIRWDIFEQQGE